MHGRVFVNIILLRICGAVSRLNTTDSKCYTLDSEGPPPPWNLGITIHTRMSMSNQSKYVLNAGVQEKLDLHSEVYECFLSLKNLDLIHLPFFLVSWSQKFELVGSS